MTVDNNVSGKGRAMHQKFKVFVTAFVLLVAGFSAVALGDGATFQGLGSLSNEYPASFANGVSGDGTVVVGDTSAPGGSTSFRWQSGQMTALSNNIDGSHAYGASANGSVVVGQSGYQNGNQAVLWANGQMTGIGIFPGGTSSIAYGVSANGSTVVGSGATASSVQAFSWSNGTMTGLGYLPGGSSSAALSISADGSVIVGDSDSALGYQAFRWQNGQMTGLGDLPGGDFSSSAWAVSADGSTVVGYSKVGYDSFSTSYEAFRWTEAGGMEGLGFLPISSTGSAAYGVSGDGSIVVGAATVGVPDSPEGAGTEAFIWDKDNGIQDLKDVLQNKYDLNLTGWTLFAATGISTDGSTIVGMGIDPAGNPEGWIATVPEPATILLVASGSLVLRKRRN